MNRIEVLHRPDLKLPWVAYIEVGTKVIVEVFLEKEEAETFIREYTND